MSFEQQTYIGSSLPIHNFNSFTLVNNVEIYPFKGSSLVRSAGTSALLLINYLIQ